MEEMKDNPKEAEDMLLPNIYRSLIGALEHGSVMDAQLALDEWRRYSALSDDAKRFLRLMLHSPVAVINEDKRTKYRIQGCITIDDEILSKGLTELCTAGFAFSEKQGDWHEYSINAMGMRVLQMESGGDVFGVVRQAELNQYFQEPDISARISCLADRFKTYYSDAVNVGSIRDFLGQFEVPSDVRRMLRILEEIRFYSKREVTRILRYQLNHATHSLSGDFDIVPFGNLADSTAEMTQTVMKDTFEDSEALSRVKSLSEVLSDETPSKIVFIDDIIGSGTQSIQIFSEMIGIREGVSPEHYPNPLSGSEIEELKKRDLCLICCHGHPSGVAKLHDFARINGLKLTICCDQLSPVDIFSDDFIPFLWSNIKNRDYWKKKFTELGKILLSDTVDSISLRRRDALGWKGGKGLTVYAHNVPTTTLTFLWKGIIVPQGKWTPLFPRRT